MLFYIVSISVREKLIALGKFEILGNWLENELTFFLRQNWLTYKHKPRSTSFQHFLETSKEKNNFFYLQKQWDQFLCVHQTCHYRSWCDKTLPGDPGEYFLKRDPNSSCLTMASCGRNLFRSKCAINYTEWRRVR